MTETAPLIKVIKAACKCLFHVSLMDGATHFTTQEVLDWFCVTKPVPKKDIVLPKLPCPPSVRDGAKKQRHSPRTRGASLPGAVLAEELADLTVTQSGCRSRYYQQLLSLEDDFVRPDGDEEEGEYFPCKLSESAKPGDSLSAPTTTTVFDNYSFDQNSNPHLPISAYQEKIISTIESGQVTIIQGSTGSGKSTQVPQYILEHYAREKRHCNIICTQPRRIAAVSVAKFVAQSRGWRLGSLVGYQIAMDKFVSEDTRLTFVTTGVLLQKLVGMKNMNQYTHVILDEVRNTIIHVHVYLCCVLLYYMLFLQHTCTCPMYMSIVHNTCTSYSVGGDPI